ncbi:MAG: adenylate kinase [Thermaerobacterales bacterium]
MKDVRCIFLGPPGAGKGTQAERVAESWGVPHIATGDIFREAIRGGTPLGEKAKEYVDSGRYVPDEVVVGMVKERLRQDDATAGFVLDGFPRTDAQASALDDVLAAEGWSLTAVVHLVVPDEVLIGRSTGRRICQECGRTYHLVYDPPPNPPYCACGATLTQRSDDAESTVRKRLEVYREQTRPLVDYYRQRKLLLDVDGNGPIQQVSARIEKALRNAGGVAG